MDKQISKDNKFIQRFIREAKTVGRLSHPNIVNVYDVGQDNKVYYMVMEYIKGCTLMEMIEKEGPLTAKEAISIMIQICEGLSHAHQNGVIHRDIKPDNIMCTTDGRYKLMDFGISRLIKATTSFTRTGTVLGSVYYFSPEQATGKEISYASDLYSLGVVLYELVTGEVPFDSEEYIAIALKHMQQPVPDPRIKKPELPVELCHIIYKAMEKDPNDRYQSAEEMKTALRKVLSSNFKNTSYWKTEQIKKENKKNNRKSKVLATLGALGVIAILLSIYGFNFANAGYGKTTKPTTSNPTINQPNTLSNHERPSQSEDQQNEKDKKESLSSSEDNITNQNAKSSLSQVQQNHKGSLQTRETR
jgi:serine/threonine protein kinase